MLNPDASSVDNPDGTETENPFGDNSNDTNDATDDPTTYIVVPVPSVYVYKSVASIEDTIADDMVGAWDTINYSFTIKNTGNVTLTDIVLTDTSLENLVLSGSTIFTLAPNQIDSTTYTATILMQAVLITQMEQKQRVHLEIIQMTQIMQQMILLPIL